MPRALKNHNAATAERHVSQELDEADVQEGEAPIPATPGKAAASGGDASSEPKSLTPSSPPDQPDTAPNTAAAESGQPPSSADAGDSRDHLSSSEKDTAPKCSDSEVVETAAVESLPSATEDVESSPASPQKAEDTSLSDSAGGNDVSVKPHNAEAVLGQTDVDASPKAESKDGVTADQKSEDSPTEQTKDDASPVPQKKDSVGEKRKDDEEALNGRDEDGGDDGNDVHQETRDSPQLPDDSVSVQPNASDATKTDDRSDASNTTAEGDIRKVPRRPASYSEYSSSSSRPPAAGKGKRFPVPSVHEEGMDQLVNALQKRLKEEDISVRPADKEGDQKSKSSEPRSARSQSEADQPEDVEVDTVHPTPASQD